MAGCGKPPQNDGDIFYKCHPANRVTHYVCVLCDSAFHVSDFKAYKGTKFISKFLVICNGHQDADLTSIHDTNMLDEQSRLIIAQVKLNQKHLIQQELQDNISNEQSIHHSDTINGSEGEFSSLKMQVSLLTQLNQEMKDKNVLLNELLQKYREDSQKPFEKSYVSAVKDGDFREQIKVPTLVIKPRQGTAKQETYSKVVSKINEKIKIPINKISGGKSGIVTIKCRNREDLQYAKNTLTDEIGTDFEVITDSLRNPKILLINISDSEFSRETLEDDINERNFKQTNDRCKVVHCYTNKKGKLNAVVEVTKELYRVVNDNARRVYVGHQSYRIIDDFNINPCYNCGQVGHSGRKCVGNIVCLRCSGDHLTRECKNMNVRKCANCIANNARFGTDYEVEHAAVDVERCEYLKRLLKHRVNNTDYPCECKPVLPKISGILPGQSVDVGQNSTVQLDKKKTPKPSIKSR